MRDCREDRGAFEVPGLVKLVLALGVLGLLGYDGFVTVATHLKAESDAQNAAYAASQAWFAAQPADRSADTAYQAAIVYLAGKQPAQCRDALEAEAKQLPPGSIPDGCEYICTGASNQQAMCGKHGAFSVDADGTVHLVVRRQAKTLVFGHLGFMHNTLIAYEHGDANQEKD